MLYFCGFYPKVDTPVKHVTMSGRRLNEGNGGHFAVSGTIDDHDMSADVELHSDAPGFDISVHMDPGILIFMQHSICYFCI